VHPLRHVLGAAACAAAAVIGLAACSAQTDATALPAAAAAIVPSTTSDETPTSAPPTAVTSESPAPAARVTVSTAPATTPKRDAASPTTARPTTAPRPAPPSSTSRPAPATSEPAPAGTSVAGQVLTLVNAERAEAGCEPVTLDDRLTKAAAGHSRDMAADDFFSHDSQDGRSFGDRIEAAGYPAPRSENIAAGQPTPAAVMDAWMHSPDHEANILDCTATQMGVAAATGGEFGTYWTQDFGTA
jgi:uncharacterized protein YkwD